MGLAGRQAAHSRPSDRRRRTPDGWACCDDVVVRRDGGAGRSKSLTTGNIRYGVSIARTKTKITRWSYLVHFVAFKAHEYRHLSRLLLRDSFVDVDRLRQNRVRVVPSHLLDVNTTLRAGQHHWTLKQHRKFPRNSLYYPECQSDDCSISAYAQFWPEVQKYHPNFRISFHRTLPNARNSKYILKFLKTFSILFTLVNPIVCLLDAKYFSLNILLKNNEVILEIATFLTTTQFFHNLALLLDDQIHNMQPNYYMHRNSSSYW